VPKSSSTRSRPRAPGRHNRSESCQMHGACQSAEAEWPHRSRKCRGASDIPGSPYADARDTVTGYTLGAGAEYAVTDNWVVRGEYRFADFGRHTSQRHFISNGAPLGPEEIELTTHDLRIGVAYKF
jgi:opacity protein-like surface antigen